MGNSPTEANFTAENDLMFLCTKCDTPKVSSCFSPSHLRLKSRTGWCRDCRKLYRVSRPEKDKATYTKYRIKLRQAALKKYGECCQCCGECTEEFLTIDHIKGGGNKHRKEIGQGRSIYIWLKINNYPEGFRTLCWNCNACLGLRGYCPHQNLLKVK